MLLPEEDLKKLESSPETAAIAKKLRDAGDFIPKSRFDEVNEQKKAHESTLAKIEADRKAADDDRALKAGEYEKLSAADKVRITELEKLASDEKKVADEYRSVKTARVERLKKDFGEKWLPEYEGFSVASLDKIEAQHNAVPKGRPDGSSPGIKPGEKTWGDMTPQEREKQIDDAKRGKYLNQT